MDYPIVSDEYFWYALLTHICFIQYYLGQKIKQEDYFYEGKTKDLFKNNFSGFSYLLYR